MSRRAALLLILRAAHRHGDCLRWSGPADEIERVRKLLYALANGPIPVGRELRRRKGCATISCVAPAHQTVRRRRQVGSSICAYGHDLNDPADGHYVQGGIRVCRRCATARRAAYRARKKLAAAAYRSETNDGKAAPARVKRPGGPLHSRWTRRS
jgi:hypothetical protein